VALDIMRSCSIKHGMGSVIFSLEMSKSEIVMRLLSAEARIKLADMRAGRMSDDDWTRMARRMSEITEAPLYIDDSPNLTMMEIRAKARRLKQKTDLRLVVVDYLQLMSSGKRVESRQAEVAEFSRNLKLLAKELDVPVVAVSQLNRGPEQRTDKLPQLSDLRETGQLEQDADLVILINRPDGYDRDSPRAGEADLILAKHRNGPIKTCTVASTLHMASFRDLARGY
jgi:replicative DNA helicase